MADEVYSRDASFWRWLEQEAKQPYVLTVNKRQPTPINFQTCYAEDLVQTVNSEDWQRRAYWSRNFRESGMTSGLVCN